MLNAQQHHGFSQRNSPYIIDILQDLRLMGGVSMVIDVADARSYDGSQTLNDVSGAGYGFFLGATSGSESSDPTYVGNGPGDPQGYLSFDGGDFLRKNSANDTLFNSLHKVNSAFGAMIGCQWDTNTTDTVRFLGNNQANASDVGVFLTKNGLDQLQLDIANGSGTLGFVGATSSVLASQQNKWHLLSIAFQDGIGAEYTWGNGTVGRSTSIGGSITSPSAAAATSITEIGGMGAGTFPNTAGTKLSFLILFSIGTLTVRHALIWNELIMRGRLPGIWAG